MPRGLRAAVTKVHKDQQPPPHGKAKHTSVELATGLQQAIAAADADIVRELLSQRADPAVQDEDGRCALHQAVLTRSHALVDILLKNGAGVDATTNGGSTALHLAAIQGNVDVVESLLAAHADVRLCSKDGRSALHCAVVSGSFSTFKVLVASPGADLEQTDLADASPLSLALELDRKSMVKHLLSSGVSVQRELAKGNCSAHQASRLRGLEMDLMRERAREAASKKQQQQEESAAADAPVDAEVSSSNADPEDEDAEGDDTFKVAFLNSLNKPLPSKLSCISEGDELEAAESSVAFDEHDVGYVKTAFDNDMECLVADVLAFGGEDEADEVEDDVTSATSRSPQGHGHSDSPHAPLPEKRIASAEEVEDFLSFLEEIGKGVKGAAWRLYFEDKEHLQVDFHRFNAVLFHLDYECDALAVFRALSFNHKRKRRVTLEDVDPESAAAARLFASWCQREFGGLLKIMRVVDRVGVGAVSCDDFVALLSEHGLFEQEDLPETLRSKDAFKTSFFPLLDPKNEGHVMESALLFLEKDGAKRKRMERQITERRLFGAERSDTQSAAGELLHGLAKASYGLGGKTWMRAAKEIDSRLAPPPDGLLQCPPVASRAASSRRSSTRSTSLPSLARRQQSAQSTPTSGHLPPIGERRRALEAEDYPAVDPTIAKAAAAKTRQHMRQLYRHQQATALPAVHSFPKHGKGKLPKVEHPFSVTQRCVDFLDPMMAEALFKKYSAKA
mmetsp:Transcript_38165/g.69507  ORF Transcript_38165/g.69507 Transcript_38165/m.69507 type:complete len:733 (-) Transcript_38165:52-2250(-)